MKQIIKGIQITEKGTALKEKENKYFFEVDISANKIDIKRAVENKFGVSVKTVNTMKYIGKKKRERTSKYGKKPDWKRAVVTLSKESKIDI